MTKRSLLILGLSTLLLVGCNTTTTSSDRTGDYNELQRMFETLQDNSFTVTYEMNYASSTHSSTQTVMYTDYAIESSGYLGFHSVAQGDELIFPYTRDSEGTIISQAPVVNYYSGLRYMRIDEYQTTFNSIDIEDVVVTYEDGYYNYDFDSNTADNNAAMISLMALMSSGSLNPTSLRFQIVGDSLVAETVGIVYSEEARDTTTARFYNVGSTEISDIKEYLDEGYNVIIFPMGRRHKRDEYPKIRKGAAVVALNANKNIVPIRMYTDYDFLQIGQSVCDAGDKIINYYIEPMEEINIQDYVTNDEIETKKNITTSVANALYNELN